MLSPSTVDCASAKYAATSGRNLSISEQMSFPSLLSLSVYCPQLTNTRGFSEAIMYVDYQGHCSLEADYLRIADPILLEIPYREQKILRVFSGG